MTNEEIMQGFIERARAAQKKFDAEFDQERTDACVRAIAKVVYDNAEMLAKMAVEETRMGVYEDKVNKNRGKAKVIWNSLKGVRSMGIISENEETGIIEIARPVGVVGAVTPCTNPIVTPMCNSMFALKGKNAIIIGPHPRAKKCNLVVVNMMRAELEKLGAPADLIQTMEEPSVELSALLMKSVDVVVATGGMPMVRSAYSSGKPAYGVGQGNVQCIIDRGVDIATTVPKIVAGRIFDNGIICSGEQTAICPKENYDAIMAEFVKNGAYYIEGGEERARLTEALFPNGVMNKNLVGQSVKKVAEAAGIELPEGTKVIVVKADGCGRASYLAKEKMCPVIASYAYDTFEEAVAIAQANLDYEGKGHSVSLHTNDIEHARFAGQKLEVARILVNQICSTMNGGALTNCLTPTTTLGCCSWGNNSISENFSHKFLLNVIRVAYPKKDTRIPTDDEIWG